MTLAQAFRTIVGNPDLTITQERFDTLAHQLHDPQSAPSSLMLHLTQMAQTEMNRRVLSEDANPERRVTSESTPPSIDVRMVWHPQMGPVASAHFPIRLRSPPVVQNQETMAQRLERTRAAAENDRMPREVQNSLRGPTVDTHPLASFGFPELAGQRYIGGGIRGLASGVANSENASFDEDSDDDSQLAPEERAELMAGSSSSGEDSAQPEASAASHPQPLSPHTQQLLGGGAVAVQLRRDEDGELIHPAAPPANSAPAESSQQLQHAPASEVRKQMQPQIEKMLPAFHEMQLILRSMWLIASFEYLCYLDSEKCSWDESVHSSCNVDLEYSLNMIEWPNRGRFNYVRSAACIELLDTFTGIHSVIPAPQLNVKYTEYDTMLKSYVPRLEKYDDAPLLLDMMFEVARNTLTLETQHSVDLGLQLLIVADRSVMCDKNQSWTKANYAHRGKGLLPNQTRFATSELLLESEHVTFQDGPTQTAKEEDYALLHRVKEQARRIVISAKAAAARHITPEASAEKDRDMHWLFVHAWRCFDQELREFGEFRSNVTDVFAFVNCWIRDAFDTCRQHHVRGPLMEAAIKSGTRAHFRIYNSTTMPFLSTEHKKLREYIADQSSQSDEPPTPMFDQCRAFANPDVQDREFTRILNANTGCVSHPKFCPRQFVMKLATTNFTFLPLKDDSQKMSDTEAKHVQTMSNAGELWCSMCQDFIHYKNGAVSHISNVVAFDASVVRSRETKQQQEIQGVHTCGRMMCYVCWHEYSRKYHTENIGTGLKCLSCHRTAEGRHVDSSRNAILMFAMISADKFTMLALEQLLVKCNSCDHECAAIEFDKHMLCNHPELLPKPEFTLISSTFIERKCVSRHKKLLKWTRDCTMQVKGSLAVDLVLQRINLRQYDEDHAKKLCELVESNDARTEFFLSCTDVEMKEWFGTNLFAQVRMSSDEQEEHAKWVMMMYRLFADLMPSHEGGMMNACIGLNNKHMPRDLMLWMHSIMCNFQKTPLSAGFPTGLCWTLQMHICCVKSGLDDLAKMFGMSPDKLQSHLTRLQRLSADHKRMRVMSWVPHELAAQVHMNRVVNRTA